MSTEITTIKNMFPIMEVVSHKLHGCLRYCMYDSYANFELISQICSEDGKRKFPKCQTMAIFRSYQFQSFRVTPILIQF